MGFSSKTVLLALMGGAAAVDAFFLGPMLDPHRMAEPNGQLERRQIDCGSGSVPCGRLGCMPTEACCNAEANWGCDVGAACYTVGGYVDCYATSRVVPTTSRACYDYTLSGCSRGMACFTCADTTAPACATEVVLPSSLVWLKCATTSSIKYITATDGTTTRPTPGPSSSRARPPSSTIAPGPITPTPNPGPDPTPNPDPPADNGGISGGAIAGIVIGAIAGIAIIAVLAFFLWKKNKNQPAQQPPHQPLQQPPQHMQQSPPPAQYNDQHQQHMSMYGPPPSDMGQYPQPPYSPLPGYAQQGGYPAPGGGMVSPVQSPVYGEQPKQPIPYQQQQPVAELGSNSH